jgi:hypothetical protein
MMYKKYALIGFSRRIFCFSVDRVWQRPGMEKSRTLTCAWKLTKTHLASIIEKYHRDRRVKMEEFSSKARTGLNANSLKLIAIAAMLCDHIAWGFVPSASLIYQLMRAIGRLTAPIMSFFIAEGYYHTRSVKKYALRLFVFSIISYFPYYLMFESSQGPSLKTLTRFNVIYTLLCGLLALWAWDKVKNPALKALAIIGLCLLAIRGDWDFALVGFVLIFGIFRGDSKKQMTLFALFSCFYLAVNFTNMLLLKKPVSTQYFEFGIFLVIPLLLCYNGERGGGKNTKWFFYIFYPAHLLILGILRLYLT